MGSGPAPPTIAPPTFAVGATSPLYIRRFDTYPPVTLTLLDQNGPISLTNASQVQFFMKGNVAPLQTHTATVLGTTTNSATATIGSNVLTGAGALTWLYEGSSVFAEGYVSPYALVSTFNATAQTVTLVDRLGNPVYATQSGTVAFTYNQGTVQCALSGTDTGVADTFKSECEIEWQSGDVTTVPSKPSDNPVIIVVPDLEDA